jgi:hypothetical protein
MIRERSTWFDDEAELHVFVPGLMATGILVSVVMFVWDGAKKFLPDIGTRKRALRSRERAAGRVNDLMAVGGWVTPAAVRSPRVRRSRGAALALAASACIVAIGITSLTIAAYSTEGGSFSGRGWTLSMGLGAAGICVASATAWLCGALVEEGPIWLQRAQTMWPIGTLPPPEQSDT